MKMWAPIPPKKEKPEVSLFIGEIMTRNVITASPSASVADVARLMRDKNIGSVVVLENGKIAGIVTERDIVTRYVANPMGRRPEEVIIGEIMTRSPVTIRDNVDVMEAARIMAERNIRRLIVVNSRGEIVGIISSRDIMRVAPHIVFIASEKLRQARQRAGWAP
jgi:CBS domain-containing protein